MAYSEEDLQKYLRKAQEVLNSKKENQLSETDLNEIVQDLGLNIEEIAQAREDYLTRGTTHLNFGNYAEAIGEFEQLLLLSPNHPKGLYGLAKAYLEKWKNHGKKADKEKALQYANQCIEVAPDYKAAYKVISTLKHKPTKKNSVSQQNNSRNSHHKKTTSLRTYLTPITVFIVMTIGVFVGMKNVFYPPAKIQQYRVGATKDGLVIWQITSEKHRKKPYYRDIKLTIADATTKKILREVAIPPRKGVRGNQLWRNCRQLGDSFYYINGIKGIFVARHLRTGKITNSKEMLAKSFKELNGGISKVRLDRSGWLEVTTKQGLRYWLNLESKKVLNQPQYYELRRARFNRIKRWWQVPRQSNNKERKVVLLEVQEKMQGYRQKRMNSIWPAHLQKKLNSGRVKVMTPLDKASYFLMPKLVYGNDDLAVIRYKTEVGTNGKYRLSCVDKAGSVLWDKGPEEVNNPLVLHLMNSHKPNVYFAQYKNTLGMSSIHIRVKEKRRSRYVEVAVGLDLTTGRLVWAHSPTLYKTKFEKQKSK
ncbi:tetratricopeptide repeat protein [Microscilla marina]|uniref:Tetratricopeptide repeat domain protein n=1 Tax=Microscilla marina ATCC 23134 TaxID=313606 RepID=A1ZDP1_MICM2|nr:tetratricopeptide repeat protein [Microscilla marina]EAY31780.1 tetratricopeptide repeat domain protein [Microscilla marina ATCC 23134]